MVERDQREKAEVALVAAINAQLVISSPKDPKGGLSGAGNNMKGGLTGLLEEGVFDGYDSDKLCPHASPVSYAILASFFSLLRRPLPARKVHTLQYIFNTYPLCATIPFQYYRTFSTHPCHIHLTLPRSHITFALTFPLPLPLTLFFPFPPCPALFQALRMADRSYEEGGHIPPSHTHGSPRRTVVYILAQVPSLSADPFGISIILLILTLIHPSNPYQMAYSSTHDTLFIITYLPLIAQACGYLFEHGCVSLGHECRNLLNKAEQAVTDKVREPPFTPH